MEWRYGILKYLCQYQLGVEPRSSHSHSFTLPMIVHTKALRKAASSVFCSFTKFETQPVSKFFNLTKTLHCNQFFYAKKLFHFRKNVTRLITKLRLHIEAKNIHFKVKNVHFKATDMQKTPSFGFRSFTKFETRPISKFLNLTKILRRNQILIFAKKLF